MSSPEVTETVTTAPPVPEVTSTPEPDEAQPREVVFDVDDLAVHYGEALAVKDVTLRIEENRITAFIGPSGCGKSTVLRCFNRMNDPIPGARVSGSLTYHGVDLYGKDVQPVEVRRRIGMVFQKPNPFPKSIYDNIAYGPRLGGIRSRSELDGIVEEALKGSALWDEVKSRLKKSAFGLSGGTQQRLCIARAIDIRPDVLLMGEPCSALARLATGGIGDLLHDLHGELCIVIDTHDM